jgi:GntR family transcriptional regulator
MREDPGARSGQASLVRDLLREYLLRDGPRPGGRLPHEHDLVRELGCSRNVLREALALLVDDGLIQRERGRGTHVVTTGPAISIDEGLDLRAAMGQEGKAGRGFVPAAPSLAVTYQVLRTGILRSPALLAGLLDVEPGAPLVHVERLVVAAGRRVGHWDVHIAGVRPDPRVALLAGTSRAEPLLRSLGLGPDHEEVRVEAIIPSPRTAGLLYQGDRHQPTLRMSRRFCAADGRIIALFIGRCALPGAAFSVVRQCAADGLASNSPRRGRLRRRAADLRFRRPAAVQARRDRRDRRRLAASRAPRAG